MSQSAALTGIERAIRANGNPDFSISGTRSIGGGCINSAMRLDGGDQSYFCKLNRGSLVSMFEAEAEGLRQIRATNSVRAPEPVCFGVEGGQAYIVMEYIEFGRGGGQADRQLGEQLAAMHRVRQDHFGWSIDNTIGSTPQPNAAGNNWLEFWREHRLGFQLGLAADNGFRGRLQTKGDRLLASLDLILGGHEPQPSLLHGDLWGGNYSRAATGEPVIFDPACYFGDREADLAMTELFGGFGGAFYAAYREAYPLDEGYALRRVLYNLYHILNHLNLFGGGYLGQAESMIDQLLAQVR